MKIGQHMGNPVDAAICETKDGSKEFVAVELEVAEGESAGEKITAELWPNDAGWDVVRSELKARFKWEGQVGTDAKGRVTFVGLKGPVPMWVYEKTGQDGKTRVRVALTPPSGIYDKSRLSMADAKSRKILAALGAKPAAVNGTRPKTPPANAGDSWEGDDENLI